MAEIVSPRAFSVEEVNHYLRETLAEDDFLANILVYGQVTGCKLHSSGHLYFTLREGNAGLKVALSVESLSAWDERLSMARRLGEEASTKLLGPLFIMLGIVMLMIMIPALMTF